MLPFAAAALAAPPTPVVAPGLELAARVDLEGTVAVGLRGGVARATGAGCSFDGSAREVHSDALGSWACSLDVDGRLRCSHPASGAVDRAGVQAFEIVGNDTVCALDREGGVTFLRPGRVQRVAGFGSGVVQIAHGGHGVCCGRTAAGKVSCAGVREWLGPPQPLSDGATAVPVLDDVVQIAYGGLAVRRDGALWRLGAMGETVEPAMIPYAVPGVTEAVGVSYTWTGPIVLREDGGVQVVDWTAESRLVGGARVALPRATALFPGMPACARLADERVMCWDPRPEVLDRLRCLGSALLP